MNGKKGGGRACQHCDKHQQVIHVIYILEKNQKQIKFLPSSCLTTIMRVSSYYTALASKLKATLQQTLVEKVDLRHLIKVFISRLTLKQQFWILIRSANTKQQSENNVIFKTSVALTGHVKDDECQQYYVVVN